MDSDRDPMDAYPWLLKDQRPLKELFKNFSSWGRKDLFKQISSGVRKELFMDLNQWERKELFMDLQQWEMKELFMDLNQWEMIEILQELDICDRKGLVEQLDSSDWIYIKEQMSKAESRQMENLDPVSKEDIDKLIDTIACLSRRVEEKYTYKEKLHRRLQTTDVKVQILSDNLQSYESLSCSYLSRPKGEMSENDSVKTLQKQFTGLLFVKFGLEYEDILLNSFLNMALLLVKFLSLSVAILELLKAIKTSETKVREVLVSWFYKVIKLILWTCGDIEKNPGPPSVAIRKLTPILCKLIAGIKESELEEKAPNGFFTNFELTDYGRIIDPNNDKSLTKEKKWEQFRALVEYCEKKSIFIPVKYWIEIQALKSEKFASLERERPFRRSEEEIETAVNRMLKQGPKGKEHAQKFLQKQLDALTNTEGEPTTEKQSNKRKLDLKSTCEGNPKRICTQTQKQNEECTSINNGIEQKHQPTTDPVSAFSTLNDESSVLGCSSDSIATPQDAFFKDILQVIQDENFDPSIAPNENYSDDQHKKGEGEGTNVNKDDSTNDGFQSVLNTQDDQKDTPGSDQLSTDELLSIFPDFLDADDLFNDLQV